MHKVVAALLVKIFYIIGMGFIGAAIGWITNVIAIKLLFRPYRTIRIPMINWELQGLIPKRQKDIAAAIANVVSSELITGHDVVTSLAREEIKEKVVKKVRKLVEERVVDRLPFMLPQVLQAALAEYVSNLLAQEVANVLENPEHVLSSDDIQDFKSEITLIVENKILSFDMQRLETIIQSLAKTELRHIELLGGVLGLLIGLLQGFITVQLLK